MRRLQGWLFYGNISRKNEARLPPYPMNLFQSRVFCPAFPFASSFAPSRLRGSLPFLRRSRFPCRLLLAMLCLVSVALLSGCAEDQTIDQAVSDYVIGDYGHARNLLRPLADKTDENFVLNNCRLGSVDLADYYINDAQKDFLRAYEVINSVGVNNGGRTLGAVVIDEKIKIWKGEPFERAMANFYLGLTYYIQQDYPNARGAFENALFKLRDYGEEGDDKGEQYSQAESNFALGFLMLAKCYQRLDRPDDARKNFERAVQYRPELRNLADFDINQKSNVLLVIDFGYGPYKRKNVDGAIVGFAPTPAEAGPIPRPMIVVDGQTLDLEHMNRPPVDLLALAQDRRWQSIDTIRVVKSALGTGLIAAGAYEGLRQHSDPGLALGLIAAGVVLKATSQADVRQWEMLPRTTFILPLSLPPGTHDVTINFPAVIGMDQVWHGIVAPSTGEATYYFRIQRYDPGPYNWPPPALTQTNGVTTVN
jgi:tetratricopeptide (TPR) repeat protein